MQQKSSLRKLLSFPVLILAVIAVFTIIITLHTISSLKWARSQGVFDTPQQGVISRVYHYYCGVESVEIKQAGTNSFDGSNPHVWFVIYRVIARSRIPCDPEEAGTDPFHKISEGGGIFWLNTKDGWVYMPEGRFPQVIGFGMKILDLAGPGDSYHVPRNGGD
jgi:hypothetical protein